MMKLSLIRVKCTLFKNSRVFYINGNFKIRSVHTQLKPRHVVEMIISGYAVTGRKGRVVLTEKGHEASMHHAIYRNLRLFTMSRDCDTVILKRFHLIRTGS